MLTKHQIFVAKYALVKFLSISNETEVIEAQELLDECLSTIRNFDAGECSYYENVGQIIEDYLGLTPYHEYIIRMIMDY